MDITDTEMLDWLDKQNGGIEHQGWGEYRWTFGWGSFKSAREVIKGAMQGKENIDI